MGHQQLGIQTTDEIPGYDQVTVALPQLEIRRDWTLLYRHWGQGDDRQISPRFHQLDRGSKGCGRLLGEGQSLSRVKMNL